MTWVELLIAVVIVTMTCITGWLTGEYLGIAGALMSLVMLLVALVKGNRRAARTRA
jgi:hypothetical protein